MKRPILTTHEHEIELEEDVIAVEFDCELYGENDGIGSYEFWGSKYYDVGNDYLVLDHLKWDESLFTKEQNEIIQQHIDNDDNWSKLEETITQKLYEQYEDDYDDYDDEEY
jgi:hypothetical protein